MYKITISFALGLVLGGCANFHVNSTMCDQVANEPNMTVPKECRNYNEASADKASNKIVDQKKVSDKDIQFIQDEEE